MPKIYLAETHDALPEMFLQEPGTFKSSSNLKWLVSTCLAAFVGIIAIGLVMYAVMDMEDGSGVLNSIQNASLSAIQPVKNARIISNRMRVASRKGDRLEVTSKGLSTRHTIHERVAQERGDRDFIVVKPYTHVIASLSTVRPNNTKDIPSFNPFKIYSDISPLLGGKDGGRSSRTHKPIKVTTSDLEDSVLLRDDGQILSLQDIQLLVAEAHEIYKANDQAIRPALYNHEYSEQNDVLPPRTTVIDKIIDDDFGETHEIRSIKVKSGDSLFQIISKFTPERWQSAEITDAIDKVFPANQLKIGQEVRFTLVPTLQNSNKLEPLAVSLFSGQKHKVTVARNNAGEYEASLTQNDFTVAKAKTDKRFPKRSTLYTSMYHAALAQQLPHEKIKKILKIHAYDLDFKSRVQLGDQFEVFFGNPRNSAGQTGERQESVGELLYTSTTVGGVKRRFYRFRTPDGEVDFYDENGSSAKKFLLRKPIRGGRFTSGFGYRIHPILKRRKMHTGVDWAAPTGTPIMASGNGIVEYVGFYGGYGRYIRIRHANGYKTAYAHLHRFAKGLRKGLKVRQGQIIGYVGSSGRSTGPHLHYELLVNSRPVNPMKIEVPRGRVLKGRMLAEFQKERARIDGLMRRAPVKTRVAKFQENI